MDRLVDYSKTMLNVVWTGLHSLLRSFVSTWITLWTILGLQERVGTMANGIMRVLETPKQGIKCFMFSSGKTLNVDKSLIKDLKNQVPGLRVVDKVEECDFILVFCPIVSRAGTEIEAALQKLQNISDSKPAVLVVLHHTFEPDYVVPDSSRSVQREETITVDFLFFERQGLLQCTKNSKSLARITNHLKLQVPITSWAFSDLLTSLWSYVSSWITPWTTALLERVGTMANGIMRILKTPKQGTKLWLVFLSIRRQKQMDRLVDYSKTMLNVVWTGLHSLLRSFVSTWITLWTILGLQERVGTMANGIMRILETPKQGIKCFMFSSGETLNVDKSLIKDLKKQVPELKVVDKVEECDFILVFCPIVSRAGTDIEAVLQKLQIISDTKPAVVVVLHHTFEPECVVPDSSRSVQREETITADFLFFEHLGLLQCTKNSKSLAIITNHLKLQVPTTSWALLETSNMDSQSTETPSDESEPEDLTEED